MVSVAGMGHKLFLHQLPAIHWAFEQEHQVGSSFVANKPGMGKVSPPEQSPFPINVQTLT